MSNDALERLKKRSRPSVPNRDTSLTPGSLDTSISGYQDTETSEYQDTANSQKTPALSELKTKQSTLRLESAISDRVSEVCKANGISREVLIEALFAHYETDLEAWSKIIAEAKKRGEHRMLLANQKRARSMMQRFS